MSQTLKVNPKIKEMIEPLNEEEYSQLRENIETDGCLDPIRVWAEHNTIIDGHNRYEICTKGEIPFEIVEIEFETLDDVLIWVVENQLGRRNVTDKQRAYLIGQRFNLEKKKRGGQEKNECATVTHSDEKPGATAEKIAKEQGVSPRTVMHNAKFAKAVDAIVEKASAPETKKKITKSNLTKSEVAKISEDIEKEPDKADEIVDKAVAAKAKKEKPTGSAVKYTLKDKVFIIFDRLNTHVQKYNNTIDSLQTITDKLRESIQKHEKLIKTEDAAKIIKIDCNKDVTLEKYTQLTANDYDALFVAITSSARFDALDTNALIAVAHEMTTVMSLKPPIYEEGIGRAELIQRLLEAVKFIQPKDKFTDETTEIIKSLESKPIKKVAETHKKQVAQEEKRKETVKAAHKKANEVKKATPAKPEAAKPKTAQPTKKTKAPTPTKKKK